jgi:hypothetical protein
MATDRPARDWRSAWPDALAFASVLALAWWTRARVSDLVWSLWLSSLVVGWTIIAWTSFRPALERLAARLQPRDAAPGARTDPSLSTPDLVLSGIGAAGTLAVFTVHFGFFHYIHGSILDFYFHVGAPHDWHRSARAQELETFRLIVRSYWPFLPGAFVAERMAFARAPGMSPSHPESSPGAEASRLVGDQERRKQAFFVPYWNVLRMHMLLFFFLLVHFFGLEHFAVYAVVYALYFFPWRLFEKQPAAYTWPTGTIEQR